MLDRRFTVHQADRVWVCDMTYVPTGEGFLYVATVMDLYSRKIIGLSMQHDLEATGPIMALRQAIARRQPQPGLICHSDRGCQYSSKQYRSILTTHGLQQSMSRKGNCWDNAPMESFFRSLKAETPKHYQTRQEAERSVFDYIEIFYNRTRLHSSLNYRSPEQFEHQATTIT